MKTKAKRMLLWTPAMLAAAAFILFYALPEFQYRQRAHRRHQHFVEFDQAILPILHSDPKFESVFLGEYTGRGRGALLGFVISTNDLENLRVIYSKTLTNHPAAVGFQVKVDEKLSR